MIFAGISAADGFRMSNSPPTTRQRAYSWRPPVAEGLQGGRTMLNLALMLSGFIGVALLIYIRHRLYE
jgi:hypothetical protein